MDHEEAGIGRSGWPRAQVRLGQVELRCRCSEACAPLSGTTLLVVLRDGARDVFSLPGRSGDPSRIRQGGSAEVADETG